MPKPGAFLGLSLVAANLCPAPATSAVSFDWVTVGAPGNACEPSLDGCFGDVDYTDPIATLAPASPVPSLGPLGIALLSAGLTIASLRGLRG